MNDDLTDEELEQTRQVMLAVTGDKLDPDEITKLLGAKPTFACRKGVKREMFPGAETEQPTGVWHLEVRDMERSLYEPKVHKVLDLVTDDLARWKKITSRFEVVMFVDADITDDEGGFFRLTPRTMGRLAERGISLLADVEDEEDE